MHTLAGFPLLPAVQTPLSKFAGVSEFVASSAVQNHLEAISLQASSMFAAVQGAQETCMYCSVSGIACIS